MLWSETVFTLGRNNETHLHTRLENSHSGCRAQESIGRWFSLQESATQAKKEEHAIRAFQSSSFSKMTCVSSATEVYKLSKGLEKLKLGTIMSLL